MRKGLEQFCSKFQKIPILLPNLNVSKRPYPCHTFGQSICLGQGCKQAPVAAPLNLGESIPRHPAKPGRLVRRVKQISSVDSMRLKYAASGVCIGSSHPLEI